MGHWVVQRKTNQVLVIQILVLVLVVVASLVMMTFYAYNAIH